MSTEIICHGDMPIKVLQNQICNFIEQRTRIKLEEYKKRIKEGAIKRAIDYDLSKDRIKFPSVSLKKVRLQELFLSFLWSITYSLFVIYEQAVMKKMINKTWTGFIVCDQPLTKNAVRLFDWAVGLAHNYSAWNLALPNPEIATTEEENYYVGKVNGIFLNSVTYLFLHEYGHLEFNHKKTGDHYLDVDQEKEADLFAREAVVSPLEGENIKFEKGLALVSAHVASLFVLRSPMGLKSKGYPDLDERLHVTLQFLNLKEKRHVDYLWFMASFSCVKFLDLHSINLELPKKLNDTRECFEACLKNFDKIKSGS